jgi:hypothetical protein
MNSPKSSHLAIQNSSTFKHPVQEAHRTFEVHGTGLYRQPKSLILDNLNPYDGPELSRTLEINWGKRSRPLHLLSLEPSYNYRSDRPWRAVNARPITESVFHADLEVHCGQTVEVALKFGVGFDARDELLKEARLYCEELLELQNKIVPYYIGIFCAEIPRKSYSTPLIRTVMVITWVGRGLPTFIHDMPALAR